jgi:very-short-patch-repair endonuclease
MNKNFDWKQIQEDYSRGLSQKDLIKKYNVSINDLYRAKKQGLITFRSKSEARRTATVNKPRTHSEETKKKISERRKAYLALHPEKVPYRLNHSSKRSMPELIFEKALVDYGFVKGIDFQSEYPMSLYQYDFAFLEQRIDIEIDGGTHTSDKVVEIDKRRDQWSLERGWRVLRLTASEVLKDVNACLNKLLEMLSLPLLEIKVGEVKIIKSNNKSFSKKKNCKCGAEIHVRANKCIACYSSSQRKVDRPTKEVLLAQVEELGYVATGKKYGVSDNAIRKWLKSM